MHYGNMKFKQKQREEQAEPDGTEGTRSPMGGLSRSWGAVPLRPSRDSWESGESFFHLWRRMNPSAAQLSMGVVTTHFHQVSPTVSFQTQGKGTRAFWNAVLPFHKMHPVP